MARVCLNMIVKNEEAILARCLEAAAPHIDCYVICDTGSTDGTVALIGEVLGRHGLPGVVVSTTFRDFEQARNEALDAARASNLAFDYLLLCDADMELRVERPDFRERLRASAYSAVQRTERGLEYGNVRLVRRDVPARYRGVTHEYLDLGSATVETLAGVHFLDHAIGANRVDKYERDIALLTQGLRDEPDNARYVFYLANTHYDGGDLSAAAEQYRRRAEMGGWVEEVFYSRYRVALCLGRLGGEDEMVARLLELLDEFPHRAEPAHVLAMHYQRQGRHRLSHHFAELGSRTPQPSGAIFVEADVHEWRLADAMAVALYWLGRHEEALALNRSIVDRVPASERERIRANIAFSEQALRPPGGIAPPGLASPRSAPVSEGS